MEPVPVLPPDPLPVPERQSPLTLANPRNRQLDAGGIVTTALGAAVAVLADPAGAEAVLRRFMEATTTAERVMAGIGLAGFLYAAVTRPKAS